MLSPRFAVGITMIVVLLVACTSPDPSGDVSAGQGGPDAVEVTAVDSAFEPDRLELTAGDRVELEITNEGGGRTTSPSNSSVSARARSRRAEWRRPGS